MATPAETAPATAAPMEVEETKAIEHEQDHKPSKGKACQEPCVMNAYDSTLNCLVDSEGSICQSVNCDGMNLLVSQIRGTVGVKKGRYYYEVQVLEMFQHKLEFCVGISAAGAKWVGEELSCSFNQFGDFSMNGECTKMKLKAIQKHQVVGVLLNLDQKAHNKNTISLFVDGVRHSEPMPLPENMLKQALFPHVSFRGCSLGVNFRTQLKATPFTVAMWSHALATDAETSRLRREEAPRAAFPIGFECDSVLERFRAANKECAFFELSKAYFDSWIKASNVNRKSEFAYGVMCLDSPHLLAPWLKTRPRHVIWFLGNLIFKEELEKTLGYLPNHSKIALIGSIGKSQRVFPKHASAILPDEGAEFTEIQYGESRDAALKSLDEWKNDQRLRSKVEDLKPGEFFGERAKNLTAFVTEKKTTDEGKQFSDEDWMLFNVRTELVNIVHAFKEDVADDTRPSFPPVLAPHYYKLYANKVLNPPTFACKTMEELIEQHLSDCLAVDASGLLTAKQEKEVEFQKIYDLVETEREARETRVGAGDELSALKFSANAKPQIKKEFVPKGAGKGMKRFGAPLQGNYPQRIRT